VINSGFTAVLAPRTVRIPLPNHGQSEKETSVEDVEAQAPQAAQVEPA
jgi:hypothetical protein